ncbi:hypothetical protein F4703DRAFT_1832651, partial [Phycomyces blakesleeanus]
WFALFFGTYFGLSYGPVCPLSGAHLEYLPVLWAGLVFALAHTLASLMGRCGLFAGAHVGLLVSLIGFRRGVLRTRH